MKSLRSSLSGTAQAFGLCQESWIQIYHLLNKLEFGGQRPQAMRARCSDFRYCPDPLGIGTAKQFDKLEFGGESPLTMRAQCSAFRYCPNPLGIVTAEQLDKLELAYLLPNLIIKIAHIYFVIDGLCFMPKGCHIVIFIKTFHRDKII